MLIVEERRGTRCEEGGLIIIIRYTRTVECSLQPGVAVGASGARARATRERVDAADELSQSLTHSAQSSSVYSEH